MKNTAYKNPDKTISNFSLDKKLSRFQAAQTACRKNPMGLFRYYI